MPNQKIENWEKALDEQWKEADHYIYWEFWVKDMIKKLLKSEKEKLLERIKLKYDYDDTLGLERGYFQAIEDLETLKEEIKKELKVGET